MKRKLLSLALSFAAALAVCGALAGCSETASSAALEFALNAEETEYAVTGIGECSGAVVIPGTHEGKPVTAIAMDAFRGAEGLTSVTIPACVVSIGADAFRGCGALTEAIFERTDGWKVSRRSDMKDAQAVEGLETPATAARYLTEDYWFYTWQLFE